MQIPLLDLKEQFKEYKAELMPQIEHLCDSQAFILGEPVSSFEQRMCAYCGASSACAVSSGSDALIIALMAEQIGPGDEIITTPYTFFATAGAIMRVGAKPVFVDIEPDSYTIDANKIEAAITSRTRAIIPVHLYGQCANMIPILELAQKHNLVIIEDAAQAIGAECLGKRAGALGDYGCFSFYPSKNLSAFGDAGLVTTQSKEKCDRLMMLRNHGMSPRYYHQFVGGNFRMDALQALVLNVKIALLDKWTAKRQANAALYDSLFVNVPEITIPSVSKWATCHVRNQYIIRILNGKRQKVWDELKQKGIGCDVYYPIPLHLQKCFDILGYKKGDFPESEKAANETLAIPIYPELIPKQIEYIANQIIKIIM